VKKYNLTRRCIFKKLVQRKCKCHKIIRKNNWNKFLKCQHYFLKKDRIFDSLHNYFISVLYQKNLKKMHEWALCVIFWEWAENIWIMCIYVVRTRSQLVFKSEFQIFFPRRADIFSSSHSSFKLPYNHSLWVVIFFVNF